MKLKIQLKFSGTQANNITENINTGDLLIDSIEFVSDGKYNAIIDYPYVEYTEFDKKGFEKGLQIDIENYLTEEDIDAKIDSVEITNYDKVEKFSHGGSIKDKFKEIDIEKLPEDIRQDIEYLENIDKKDPEIKKLVLLANNVLLKKAGEISNHKSKRKLVKKQKDQPGVETKKKPLKKKAASAKIEQLKGGLADNLAIEDLAQIHGRSIEFMRKQLEKGIQVEMEHTRDRDGKAHEIAMDHLFEDPEYYIKLEKLEKKPLLKRALKQPKQKELNI